VIVRHASAGFGTAGITSLVPGGDAVNTLWQLSAAGKTAQDYINLFSSDGTDPQVSFIAQYCINSLGLSDVDLADPSALGIQIRQQCAIMYEEASPDGFINSVRSTGANFGIENTLEVPTDLVGDGISALLQLGTVETQAVKGLTGILIDFFLNPHTNAAAVLVASVPNPGSLQVPTGTNTFLYSFGGTDQPGSAKGFTIAPATNGPIIFTPGQSQDFSVQPSQFINTGSMTVPRGGGHTATLLNNGKVLIAGGVFGSTIYSSAELYDPATGTFAPTGGMLQARRNHTATLLPDGHVLIAGGLSPSAYLASAEIYDPSAGLFATTGPMSASRAVHTATLLNNGRVLIAGGVGTTTYLFSAELYDPGTGTFAPTGGMEGVGGREGHTATLLSNGDVLVAGGVGNPYPGAFGGEPSAEIYNALTGSFSPTDPMITVPIFSNTATLLPNGAVLIAGGTGVNGGSFATTELYNSTGGFFSAGALITGRQQHTATLLPSGAVFIVGGFNSNSTSSLVGTSEFFNPATGAFAAGPNLKTPRMNHTATLLPNGTVLIVGGLGQTTVLASAEIAQ
jgi:hypothetical protein